MWATASSPSPSSSSTPSSAAGLPLPKTMEEVWKDITLPADLPPNHPAGGVIFQDFFSKDPSPAAATSASPPPTFLTLSSAGPNRLGSLLLPLHNPPIPNPSNLTAPFDALVPDVGGGTVAAGKKRFMDTDKNPGDRRHKRMIKNRESAARSRARKQAYTNELELEVAHLVEENARLKEQQKQLCRAAAAAQNEKKKPLQRTSTAPF